MATKRRAYADDVDAAYARWRERLGTTGFITFCFLRHLISPTAVPILDQHNFRAVNHHLASIGVDVHAKQKPSTIEDLYLVRDFAAGVLQRWPTATSDATPATDELHRYLMMFEKHFNKRGRLTTPPPAS